MSKAIPEEVSPTTEQEVVTPRKQNIVWSLSVVLGTLISVGVVLGFVGRTLYVTREEYNSKTLQDAQDKTVTQQTLSRVETLLSRQETAFEKLWDSVQNIRVEMAGRQYGPPARK